jgi:hypothetical protein
MPQAPWYLGERAESYAVVLFTRVAGVRVDRTQRPNLEADLVVRVDADAPTRTLAIEVKGTEEMHGMVRGDGMLRSTFADQLQRLARDVTVPFGVLIVDVVREKARFGWVREPKDKPRGGLTKHHLVKTCLVTDQVLQDVVDGVKAWYTHRAA